MVSNFTDNLIVNSQLFISFFILLLAFLFLIIRRPVIGFICFIFLVLTRAHEYLPNSAVYRPSVLLGMCMLVGLFFHISIKKLPLYFTLPQSLILAAFVAFCCISLFIKVYFGYSNSRIGDIEDILLVIIAYFVLLNSVRNLKDVGLIIFTLLWIGIAISALTLIQSFVTGIMYREGASWFYKGSSGEITRAGSLGLNPNYIAIVLPMLLPFFYFFLEQEANSVMLRRLIILGIPLLVVTTMLTLSRTGFICLVVAFLMIFSRRLSFKFIFGFSILLMIILFITPSAYFDRISNTGSEDPTGSGRLLIWLGAIKMILAHPLTGVGYGQFMSVFSQYQPYYQPAVAHNTYLSITAETGFINLFIYLSLILVTFFDMKKIKSIASIASDRWTLKLVDSLKVALVVALLGGLTINTHHNVLFYILIALVVMMKRVQLEKSE